MGGGVGELALQGACIGEVLEDDDQPAELVPLVHDRRHDLTDAAARIVTPDEDHAAVLVGSIMATGRGPRHADPLPGFLVDRPVDMGKRLAERLAADQRRSAFRQRDS